MWKRCSGCVVLGVASMLSSSAPVHAKERITVTAIDSRPLPSKPDNCEIQEFSDPTTTPTPPYHGTRYHQLSRRAASFQRRGAQALRGNAKTQGACLPPWRRCIDPYSRHRDQKARIRHVQRASDRCAIQRTPVIGISAPLPIETAWNTEADNDAR